VTAGQLAAAMHLSSGAVTTLVDRLERAGYARRVRDTAIAGASSSSSHQVA